MTTNKKLTRPVNPLPSWANDANINDPGEPWDGTPTKVQPGAGKRDDGFLPEENPNAQHVNQLLHEAGAWIQYMSDIQAMNWEDVTSSGISSTGESLTFDEGANRWYCGGQGDVVLESEGEVEWDNIDPTGVSTPTQDWDWAASKRMADLPTHTGPRSLFGDNTQRATNRVAEYATGGWTAVTLPKTGATCGSTCAIYDATNQLWLVFGSDVNTPSVWYGATAITAFTQVLPTKIVSSTLKDVAHNRTTGLTVAIGDGILGDVIYSTNGTTWNSATPTGITAGERWAAIEWDEDTGLFVGLTTTACYTSTNGIAWTLVSSTYTSTQTFRERSLALCGSLWVSTRAAASGDSVSQILYSTNGGVDWRRVAVDVIGKFGTTNMLIDMTYSRLRGRFVCLWTNASLNAHVIRSLAVATTLQENDDTLLVPTVT